MIRHADEISTKRGALRLLLTSGSGRLIGGAGIVVGLLRIAAGRWSLLDLAVAALVLASAGFVEWFAHRVLMHAGADSWAARRLGTGQLHRRHHVEPADVRWIFLKPGDVLAFFVGAALIVTVLTVTISFAVSSTIVSQPLLRLGLTTMAVAVGALAHYEWTHLLVHTRYRPRTRFYARLERNHRLHHFRNERHWIGVTSNLGDRVMGTLPAARADVPLSTTARTLN